MVGGLIMSCISLSRISDRNCTRFSPLLRIRSARLCFSSLSNCTSFFIGGSFCSWAILHSDRNRSIFSSWTHQQSTCTVNVFIILNIYKQTPSHEKMTYKQAPSHEKIIYKQAPSHEKMIYKQALSHEKMIYKQARSHEKIMNTS